MAAFIGAASDREVVFTRNATEAINLVAQTWGLEHIKEGDEVQLAPYAKGCSSSLGVLGNVVWLLIDMRSEFDLLMHTVCLLQIVLSVAEHHGNLVPWQMLAQRTGAVLRHAELTSTQEVDVEVSSTDSNGKLTAGLQTLRSSDPPAWLPVGAVSEISAWRHLDRELAGSADGQVAHRAEDEAGVAGACVQHAGRHLAC